MNQDQHNLQNPNFNGMQFQGQQGYNPDQQTMYQGMNPMMNQNAMNQQQQPNQDNQAYDNQDNENNEDSNDPNGEGKKQGTRRSKHHTSGRNHQCKYCNKTYLSYPALYTHIKQKHSQGPNGEQRTPPSSGKGRGRPRKHPLQRIDPKSEDYYQLEDKKGGPTDPSASFEEVFTKCLLVAQPTKFKSHEEYPMYRYLQKILNQNNSSRPANGLSDGDAQKDKYEDTQQQDAKVEEKQNQGEQGGDGKPSTEEGDKKEGDDQKADTENGKTEDKQDGDNAEEAKKDDDKKEEGSKDVKDEDKSQAKPISSDVNSLLQIRRNYDNLSEQDRQDMKVDEIFAMYLSRICKKVNDQFYQIILAYVIFFRECLNEIGWQKKSESENHRTLENSDLQHSMQHLEFCLENNAEHAPEICNEFVTVFMEDKINRFNITKSNQIDLTINLCHWLFENQFTCSKLTMIQ